jgi:hypothetical protein
LVGVDRDDGAGAARDRADPEIGRARKYGLSLALFDALVFPLLLLDGFVYWAYADRRALIVQDVVSARLITKWAAIPVVIIILGDYYLATRSLAADHAEDEGRDVKARHESRQPALTPALGQKSTTRHDDRQRATKSGRPTKQGWISSVASASPAPDHAQAVTARDGVHDEVGVDQGCVRSITARQ